MKHENEPSESTNETSPVVRDLGSTPTIGKENSEAIHRLSVLQVGKDSSPNTAAAEATAIAGIAALTQVLLALAALTHASLFSSPLLSLLLHACQARSSFCVFVIAQVLNRKVEWGEPSGEEQVLKRTLRHCHLAHVEKPAPCASNPATRTATSSRCSHSGERERLILTTTHTL